MTRNSFGSIVMVLLLLFLCDICETGLLRLPYWFADQLDLLIIIENLFITSDLKQEFYRTKDVRRLTQLSFWSALHCLTTLLLS